jgi:hypothetical protein
MTGDFWTGDFWLKATSRVLEGCRGQLEDLKEVTAKVGGFPVAPEPF